MLDSAASSSMKFNYHLSNKVKERWLEDEFEAVRDQDRRAMYVSWTQTLIRHKNELDGLTAGSGTPNPLLIRWWIWVYMCTSNCAIHECNEWWMHGEHKENNDHVTRLQSATHRKHTTLRAPKNRWINAQKSVNITLSNTTKIIQGNDMV